MPKNSSDYVQQIMQISKYNKIVYIFYIVSIVIRF